MLEHTHKPFKKPRTHPDNENAGLRLNILEIDNLAMAEQSMGV